MVTRRVVRGGAAAAVGSGVAAHGLASGLPTAPAVFVSPHQDDELLSMGAAIMEHVALGRDVRVLLIGRGNKSAVRTSQALFELIGYVPTEAEFGGGQGSRISVVGQHPRRGWRPTHLGRSS